MAESAEELAAGAKKVAKDYRKRQRLEIAMRLLEGQLLELDEDGYDPGGFAKKRIRRRVNGALDMAEQLIERNERYGKDESDDDLADG